MGWHRERRSAEGGAEQQERSVQRSLDVRKEHSYRSDDDSKSAGGAASVRQTPIGDQRALLSVGPAGMRAGTSIRDVRTAQTSWTGGLFHRSFFFLGKNCRAPAGVPHSRTLQPWHGCPAFGDRRILSAGIGSDLRAPFVLFASCIRAPPRQAWRGRRSCGLPARPVGALHPRRALRRVALRSGWRKQQRPGASPGRSRFSVRLRGPSPDLLIRLRRSQTKRWGAPVDRAVRVGTAGAPLTSMTLRSRIKR